VLCAPSWVALQLLIDVLFKNVTLIDIICNVQKTVCMAFNPIDRHKIVLNSFRNLL